MLKLSPRMLGLFSLAAVLAAGTMCFQAQAADAQADAVKEVMKKFHKAPKGEDPICKKAIDGKATAQELKDMVAGYKKMAAAKVPHGDAASWKTKTTALLAASEALQKNTAGAVDKYKEAVNCKACHSEHKAD